jgi:hypothetical protein
MGPPENQAARIGSGVPAPPLKTITLPGDQSKNYFKMISPVLEDTQIPLILTEINTSGNRSGLHMSVETVEKPWNHNLWIS